MITTSIFDVLVVYTDRVATSASSKKLKNINPFSLATGREHYSIAYAYFLTKCKNLGLKVAFTTSGDIVGPGTCKSFWIYKNKKWIKKEELGFSPIVFDKFAPLRKSLQKKRMLMFKGKVSEPFTDSELLILFNDKLKTYKKLSDFTIPTVRITKDSIEESILRLEKLVSEHKNKIDFENGYVLKDRFGAGGLEIYKIKRNTIEEIAKILKNSPKISFVLQPFANFDNGYNYRNVKGFADIRIIFSQGKIIQRYIRTAKDKDFRCNEHQGGKVIYVGRKAIPKKVSIASDQIINILDKKNALFALDFLVSNNGNAYFLEGNINPGIYWGINSYEDKINTKKLIRTIIMELVLRVNKKSDVNHELETVIPKSRVINLPLESGNIILA